MRQLCLMEALALGLGVHGGWGPSQSTSEGFSHVYCCPVDRAWAAVEETLADLEYVTIDDRHDLGGGILHARRNDVGEIAVRAAPYLFEGTTLVSVAAPNEDRGVEEDILARLDARLRAPAPGGATPTSFRPKDPAAGFGARCNRWAGRRLFQEGELDHE